MRNDDSFDDEYAAPVPPVRTDDVASAGPVSDVTGPQPTLMDGTRNGDALRERFTALATRSRRGADGLRTALGLRVTNLASAETRDRARQARDRIGQLLGRRGNAARLTVAASVVSCLSLAMFAEVPANSADPAVPVDRVAVLADRALADQAASRATRGEPAAPETTDPDTQEQPAPAQPAPPAETVPPAEQPTRPAPPVDPGPVAGLTNAQMNNAKAIVRTGRDMQMPRRALIIAVATAMQESNLLNLASGVLPESMNYPNQGVGWDHDSVGLFQQRTSTGWGPVNKLMDPAYATARFLEALMRVPGWQWMRLTEAAQAVQVSAFPEHYAKHEGRATIVVDAIVPGWQ